MPALKLRAGRQTLLDNALKGIALQCARQVFWKAEKLHLALRGGVGDGWVPPNSEVLMMANHLQNLALLTRAEVMKYTEREDVVIQRVLDQIHYRKINS